MKKRMVVTLGGVALMAGGAVVCRPAAVQAWPLVTRGASALTLPMTAPAIDADRITLTATYGTLRGDTALGQAPVPEGAGAALLGLLVTASAVGGGIAKHRDPEQQKKRAKEQEKAEVEAPIVATKRDLKRDGWLSSAGWPLGKDISTGRRVYLPRKDQTMHTLVIGGTGSGKSSAALIRWIVAERGYKTEKRASLIVIDPKGGGELTDTTIGLMEQAGYRVWVYDPLSPGTLRFNALGLAPTAAQVKGVVARWVECLSVAGSSENSFWRNLSIALIAGAAIYLRREAIKAGQPWQSVSMADVADFYRNVDMEDATALIIAAGSDRNADRDMKGIAAKLTHLQGSKKTRDDAMTGVEQRLDCLTDDRIAASMVTNDMDPTFWQLFVDQPTVLYVPIGMHEASQIKPVVVTFLVGAIDALDRIAGVGNTKLKRPVRIIVDEFANLGKISGMVGIASTIRFRDMGLVLAIQSLTGVKKAYGIETDSLMENLLTHVVLAKSVPAALKRYAVADLNLGLVTLMQRKTALVQRAGDLPIRVKTQGWFEARRLRVAQRRAKDVCDKATILRWQADLHAEEAADVDGALVGASLSTAQVRPGILDITTEADDDNDTDEEGVDEGTWSDIDEGERVTWGEGELEEAHALAWD